MAWSSIEPTFPRVTSCLAPRHPGGGSVFVFLRSDAAPVQFHKPSRRRGLAHEKPSISPKSSKPMPMPWETFIPLGLLTVMFGASGTLLNAARRFQNDGKPPDYTVDKWDEMMQERNRRLTGSLRGQCVEEKAPLEFQTSSAWPVEKVV
ncbi:hypothetical protein PGTUg99_013089 [Puccinia graminis f. sp. tritici]|uniref:NADH dehydrogenase [ubiquinone] 1 alpha subcomplex subunit 1 n=2 Tax=Puccinia graminis f. sp. tritici TaxID=56615 RepID=E3K2I5_PUCGT|nr:uncharacterized protein PGTG_04510 [Puccinia graminis f. sp. tritici CRL 75-36-700-3]EFP78554.2 hypothetical protein PGTG_04510 [Puccinia graminis f. sp. tritici CRL 75-36-700-3]KAA1078770.1 hypothetical protein PGTUg99_013089 [Puccinia graminis f. sp. tritici]